MPASQAHRTALLLRHRCGECAEQVEAAKVLRAEDCAHCGSRLAFVVKGEAEPWIDSVLATWRGRRWLIYGLTAFGTLLAGFLPLAATLVMLVALLLTRHALLRTAVGWLGPKRRITTKLIVRMAMVLTAMLALLADQVLSLVPALGIVAKAVVAVVLTVVFLETSLRFVVGRIRREQRGPELDIWEWLLPLLLLLMLLATTAAVVFVFLWVINLLQGSFAWLLGLLGSGA